MRERARNGHVTDQFTLIIVLSGSEPSVILASIRNLSEYLTGLTRKGEMSELLLGPYQPLQIGIHGLACVGNYVIFPLQVMLYSRGCPAHSEYESLQRCMFEENTPLSILSLFPFSSPLSFFDFYLISINL